MGASQTRRDGPEDVASGVCRGKGGSDKVTNEDE